MARSPKKGKPVEEKEDSDYSDTDNDEEEDEWRKKMISYAKRRVLEFMLSQKLPKEENAILKKALELYVTRMMGGMYDRHSKKEAWEIILTRASNELKKNSQQKALDEAKARVAPEPEPEDRKSVV